MNFTRATARIHFTVPPGESLVGFMPLTMFRVDSVKLSVDPLLKLGAPLGQYLTFDGAEHELRSDSGRTLCVGNFIALLVKNGSTFPRAADLWLSGVAVDWPPNELVEGKVLLGAFAQEADKVDTEALVADVEANTMPEAFARMLAELGLTRAELAVSLETPEGRDAIRRRVLTPTPDTTFTLEPLSGFPDDTNDPTGTPRTDP